MPEPVPVRRKCTQVLPVLAMAACLCLIPPAGWAAAFNLSLEGGWKISRDAGPGFSSPALDDSRWPSINLPSRFLMPVYTTNLFPGYPPVTRKGFLWLRKYFVLDRIPGEKLVFQAGEIMNADETWVNGVKVGVTGSFPPRFRSGWANFRNYEVDPSLLRTGTNCITVRVYFDAECTVSGPVRLADSASGGLQKMFMDMVFINFMESMSFLLLFISLFFIIYFILRPRETAYLVFSLACISVSMAISLQYMENHYPYLPFSSNSILLFTQAGLLFVGPMVSLFVYFYLYRKKSLIRLLLSILVPGAGCLLMFLAGDRSGILAVRNLFILVLPVFLVLTIVDTVVAIFRGLPGARFFTLAMIPLYLFTAHDVLTFGVPVFKDGLALFIFGFPLMLLIIALRMIRLFAASLNTNEKQREELEMHRKNLEDLVKERTMVLEKTTEKLLAHYESMDAELSLARRLQMRMVPTECPCPGVAFLYRPMRHVGGDFFDFIIFGQGTRIGLFLSDVSGHGVPAAFITSMIKSIISQSAQYVNNPAWFLEYLNRALINQTNDNFITAFYGILDRSTGEITYANAGHHCPIWISGSGQKRLWSEYRGFPLGIFESGNDLYKRHLCRNEKAMLSPGDKLFLFTDGLLEATNETADLNSRAEPDFEQAVLNSAISELTDETPENFVSGMYRRLVTFRGSEDFDDDVCMICLELVRQSGR